MRASSARTVRRGVALFAALALMVVMGLLAGGAVAALTLSQRSLHMARVDAVLTANANYGLSSVLSNSDGYGLADLPLGVSRTVSVAVGDAGADSVAVTATRLTGNLLWLIAVARSNGSDGGLRRFNMIARFPFPEFVPPAGIVARGDIRLGHDVVLSRDTSSTADCGPVGSFDVALAPGATLSGGSPTDTLRVLTSAVEADSASYYLTTRQLSLLEAAGRMLHVHGDTTISGGTFSGILVVDGALTIDGPFHAIGVIIAGGRVKAVAGGFNMEGAVMSFAPAGAVPVVDLAAAGVFFSPCTVSRAFRLAAPPRPVPKRSWAEMF